MNEMPDRPQQQLLDVVVVELGHQYLTSAKQWLLMTDQLLEGD